MVPSVYILKDDTTTSRYIVQALLSQFNEDSKLIVVIGCSEYEEIKNKKVQKFDTLSQYLMHVYRTLKLHKNERQTIYSEEDQLLATQLCMADYNRENHDFYDAATSEVLATSDHLIRDAIDGTKTTSNSKPKASTEEYENVARCYWDFLKTCNSMDLGTALHDVKTNMFNCTETTTEHWSKSKCVVLQWPRNIIEASFLSLLCHTSGRYLQTTAEVPVCGDPSKESIVISTEEVILPICEDMLVKSIPSSCATPNIRKSTTDQKLSVTEIYFKRVFLSYLTLVVNTREELALARCFNVPDRELDHDAFTALKREARLKNMPMHQTATSYVMKIRIGRKNYISDPSCQIAQYVRGLSEFVSLIQKLQVIVEEEKSPSSGLLRLINQIKTTFLKAKKLGFNTEVIEKVVRYLKLSVGKLSDGDSLETPQKSVGNGGSMAGMKTIKLLRKLLDREASQVTNRRLDILCDGMASQGTPVRLPSLISMFRSPAIPSPESPENQPLVDRLLQKENEQQGCMKRMGYRSCMMWADPRDLQNDQCVNTDYLRAIANENTQRSPGDGWKNTIWASDNNTKNNEQKSSKEIPRSDETMLEVIDTICNQESCNKTAKNVTAGETPKGRGKLKRQPFREMNEQSVMKKAKNDKPNPKKKKVPTATLR